MDRKPIEGVLNVVKFNWHFYAIILGIITVILLTFARFPDFYQALALTFVFFLIMPVLISLLITYKVYDATNLYELTWLQDYKGDSTIASFNAGFDETTLSMRKKMPRANIIALDFYDEKKHTEVSIKRARKAYPQVAGTIAVHTTDIPLEENSVDLAVGFLSMHEIRDEAERIEFFKNLKKILKPDGEVILIEHLRDLPNFLAYNIGFLHFHSHATWIHTFNEAGFKLQEEEKINPFMSKFRLSYGTTT